jgi:hypothetical protein
MRRTKRSMYGRLRQLRSSSAASLLLFYLAYGTRPGRSSLSESHCFLNAANSIHEGGPHVPFLPDSRTTREALSSRHCDDDPESYLHAVISGPLLAKHCTSSEAEGETMDLLWTVAVILVILWLLGLVTSYSLGGFVHILLVLAIIVILIRVIQGRRPI